MTVCMSTCRGNPGELVDWGGGVETRGGGAVETQETGYMKETEMCVELQPAGGTQKNW